MSFYEHFSEVDLALLRARAERAAAVFQKSHVEKLITVLQIRLDHEAYALPIETLHAVYEGITVVPVPCVPAFVDGIANVRGQIVPVLNLAILLGGVKKVDTGTQPLIVVTNRTMTIAFAVETIGDVIAIAESDIMALPNTPNTPQSVYLSGVLPNGAGLLDIHTILSDPSMVVSEIDSQIDGGSKNHVQP